MHIAPSVPHFQAQLLVDCRCLHGEGPVWDHARDRLFWVDIMKHRIYACDANGEDLSFCEFDEPVCAFHPEPGGTFLVAFAKRLARVEWGSGKVLETLGEVEPGRPENRCNDGKMDPSGRFWIGTMSSDGSVQGAGSLYQFDQGKLKPILNDLTIANGMGWASDQRTMYFIDTPTREVWAFDFDPRDSSIRNRRSVITMPDDLGFPDGMCVAPDDTLWVAGWGAGTVSHWDPSEGRLLEVVNTGAPQTSSCALGPDGRLFITTSRLGLTDLQLAEAPSSGGLFVYQP